ncbi:aspartate carbamoyltransferase catalytic subunit [Paracoccus aurantiacus]|uniref:Aspartate carbamoyltransferase catalytic subunit n=1 Tax=Paracoccus aurantiacus TaxID=2599412 RepID=A0A5C6S820_9RHOB|nr:aspartate carbamoyltransferase catalytic subunit [Paracoccus aurantiacus]TXB69892.1 aspartate carbamoyltransferase catalytic subunit [Paracoccus aurantiacus]
MSEQRPSVYTENGSTDYPGWQGILEPGEQILWQGQPDRRFRFAPGDLAKSAPGLFMTCFSLFWMWNAAQGSLVFSLFGLFFLFAGLREMARPVLLPAYIRSRSWYTLTDRRAIVATDMPIRGRRLLSYPIDAGTPMEYVAGDPPSILFGPETRNPRNRAGFHFIPEADRVMALMRRMQRGDTAPSPSDDARGPAT